MNPVIIEAEALIHKIQDLKLKAYEAFSYADGLEDPDVLAQVTSKVLGAQAAYDDIIFYLMGLQGCDPE